MPREFRHPHAVVEVLDRMDYGCAFRPRLREPDCIRNFAFGNINRDLHIPILTQSESHLYILGFQIRALLHCLNGSLGSSAIRLSAPAHRPHQRAKGAHHDQIW